MKTCPRCGSTDTISGSYKRIYIDVISINSMKCLNCNNLYYIMKSFISNTKELSPESIDLLEHAIYLFDKKRNKNANTPRNKK